VSTSAFASSGASASSSCAAAAAPSVAGSATSTRSGASSPSSPASSRMPARSAGEVRGVSITARPSTFALRSARNARGAFAGIAFMIFGLRIICSSPWSSTRLSVAQRAGSAPLAR